MLLLLPCSASGVAVHAPAQVASHAVEIHARYHSTPALCPPPDGDCITTVQLEQLQAGKDGSLLCDALRRDHVALVELPAGRAQQFDAMWASLHSFFDMPASEREEAAGALRAIDSEHHAGQVRSFGFASSTRSSDCFLDTRQRQADDGAGVQLQPPGIDESVPGFTAALEAAQRVLTEVGLAALTAAVASLGVDASEATRLVDFPSELEPGATCATVHRCGYYEPEAEAQGGADAGAAHEERASSVAFQPHTDGTWFTVIPCAAVPGLEVFASPAHGWMSPERAALRIERDGGAAAARMVAVLPGEFLELLSAGEYSCALHRVVRPVSGGGPRVSAPLLMRGSTASGFSGGARDNTLVGGVLAARVCDEESCEAVPAAWWRARRDEELEYGALVERLTGDAEAAKAALTAADAEYEELEERFEAAVMEADDEESESMEASLMRAAGAAAEAELTLSDAQGALDDAKEARFVQVARDGDFLRAHSARGGAPGDTAHAEEPASFDELFAQGTAHVQSGALDLAMGCFQRAAKLDPAHTPTRTLLERLEELL